MKVILISGKAGSGKDTVAEMMKEQLSDKRVLITHFADVLKYICKTYCGWNEEKDEAGRTLLQTTGDKLRENHPYWAADFMWYVLDGLYSEWDYVIIPDLRYIDEFDTMELEFNTVSVRIERPAGYNSLTPEQQRHSSETELDNVEFDYTIINEGTLEDLAGDVRTVLEYIHQDAVNDIYL